MTTKIQKWGNSLAIRLPKKTADRLVLKEGSEVEIDELQNSIIIKKVTAPRNAVGKLGWKDFVLPSSKKKKESVSLDIDTILYGKSS